MSDLRNARPPMAPPTTPPPFGSRLIGFFLLGGIMWLAGLLALFRAVMAVVPS